MGNIGVLKCLYNCRLRKWLIWNVIYITRLVDVVALAGSGLTTVGGAQRSKMKFFHRVESGEPIMPVGKVKWFDADKGFGFVSNPGDEDVYVGRNVLPAGVEELVQGQRIEFDFAAGRRGPQALRIKILETPRRKAAPSRKPEELSSMLSDVMTLLENQVQPALARGRYPERKTGRQVAEILRAIAKDLDS